MIAGNLACPRLPVEHRDEAARTLMVTGWRLGSPQWLPGIRETVHDRVPADGGQQAPLRSVAVAIDHLAPAVDRPLLGARGVRVGGMHGTELLLVPAVHAVSGSPHEAGVLAEAVPERRRRPVRRQRARW